MPLCCSHRSSFGLWTLSEYWTRRSTSFRKFTTPTSSPRHTKRARSQAACESPRTSSSRWDNSRCGTPFGQVASVLDCSCTCQSLLLQPSFPTIEARRRQSQLPSWEPRQHILHVGIGMPVRSGSSIVQPAVSRWPHPYFREV